MNKAAIIILGVLSMMLLPRHGHTQSEGARIKALWGGAMLGGGLIEQDGKGADGSQTSRESKLGFAAGGHLSYDLHQRVALHVEVLFTTKGSHQFVLGEKRYSYSLSYLELPLLARVSWPSIKDTISLFVALGPEVGFLLRAKGEDVRLGEPLDLEGVYTSIDFGVIFAAGAAMRISSYDMLGLEARYDMGLRAIVPDREAVYNRGLLLMLRYQTCICSRSAAR